MFGAAMATIVWSMKVMATANIIAVSATYFERLVPPCAAPGGPVAGEDAGDAVAMA
ncbi:hypothetical protein GCM10009836_37660 [Pseudonocardia ailaonensis]|uniref:Uncharacterized protein n=1 Tax=Pseudonocardia ailaonensis TaxID=367279 RepID=A0ABN2N6T3_9PSEU